MSLKEAESHFNLEQIQSNETIYLSLTTSFVVLFGIVFTLFYMYRKIVEMYYRYQQNVVY